MKLKLPDLPDLPVLIKKTKKKAAGNSKNAADKPAGKANILVLGTSGAGKSTLINAVIGKEVAKVGSGKHVTEMMTPYESEDLSFRLIDSRGFEYSYWNTRRTVKDMDKWIRSGLGGKQPRIHMLWFCVDATSKRFTAKTMKTLEYVKKEWKDIPIIVVLTKSFFPAEDEENIEMVKETFSKVARTTGMPKAIIPVLAQPPKGVDILPRGIDELIKTTEMYLGDAFRDSDEAVWQYGLKLKRMNAQALTLAAASSAAVVGAVPIGIPDSIILTPLETGLITGISKIYGMDQGDDFTRTVTTRIIEAGAVSLAAKTILNQLKMVPGVVNLAADVLNAIVAGTIVFGIGEASAIIMEKVYVGDIDRENLDWINGIVNSKLGTVVTMITEIVAKNDGKISAGEIIEMLAKKK